MCAHQWRLDQQRRQVHDGRHGVYRQRGASASFSSANAGSETATGSLTLTGADHGNYTLTAPTATATITPKALTYSGLSVPSSMPYNGTTTAMVSRTASLPSTESAGGGQHVDWIVQCGRGEPDGNGDGDVQQQGCGDGGAGNIRGLVADGDGVRQLHTDGADAVGDDHAQGADL